MKWKRVPGFPDWVEASDAGQIRLNGEVAPGGKHPGGYLKVRVLGKSHYVHRLIAKAFCGEATGPLVRHLDGDPTNNVPSNLAWGTTSDNLRDAVRHGTYRNGAMNKTHCRNGHAYDEANTYIRAEGWRACRACLRANTARYRERKRAQLGARP